MGDFRDVLPCEGVVEGMVALLDGYIAKLEARKQAFGKTGQPNLDAYNRAMGVNLPRYILACDEIAEVLDKTGLAKEQKELVGQIEDSYSSKNESDHQRIR